MSIKEVAIISRDLDYFSVDGLTRQLGYQKSSWPYVAMAESIDNALDHVEEIGREPVIAIDISGDRITVSDSGDGMPESVIRGLADFGNRYSSKVGFQSPSRGKQGNASKCLVAAPSIWGGGKLELVVGDVIHTLTASVDEIQQKPVVDHQILTFEDFLHPEIGLARSVQNTRNVKIGTTVSLVFPGFDADADLLLRIVAGYAICNPHASFILSCDGEVDMEYAPTTSRCRKWLGKDDVHWYTSQTFRSLVANSINCDRAKGKDRTVSDFVGGFAKFSRHDVRRQLVDECELSRVTLSELFSRDLVDRVMVAMQASVEPIEPTALGTVGRSHFQKLAEELGGYDPEYRCARGVTKSGLPYVLEVGFAATDESECFMLTSVNDATDLGYPKIKQIPEILKTNRLDSDFGSIVFVSLRQPGVTYRNPGKTELNVDSQVLVDLVEALRYVLRKHLRAMKALERTGRVVARRKDRTTVKAAVLAKMEESIAALSVNGTMDFDARSHYYWMRSAIQQLVPDAELEQKYLDSCIDEWEAEHGIIENRMRDPRGFLYEPHTMRTVPLGTRDINDYEFPDRVFQNILYIEKKGLLPLLTQYKIPEAYDLTIVASEGYSTRAAQCFMQRAALQNMRVIVFHDADPSGYMIANALGKDSGAHAFDFQIVDAGLTVAKALQMGLQFETFSRKSALSTSIDWRADELRLFGGKESTYTRKDGSVGKCWSDCHRCELNALSAYPRRFVAWVESELAAAGFNKKLLPKPAEAETYAIEVFKRELHQQIQAEVEERLEVDRIVDEAFSKVEIPDFAIAHAKLRMWAKELRPESWRAVLERLAKELIVDADIVKAVGLVT